MLKYICLNTQRDAIESNDASDIRDAVQAIDDLKAALTLDQGETDGVAAKLSDLETKTGITKTVEGVADTSALSVPVRVTLPIPANINPGFLVILHYDSAGNPTAISDPYIYQEGGKWMTSFVVDHFSPFALTEYKALPLTKDMFTVDTADAAHTGSPITKTITSELVLDRDYTVSYSNNTNIGTATIVITGIGDYSGELTYTFNIKAGSVDGSGGSSGGSSRPSINTNKTPSADDKQDDTAQTPVWENPYPDVAADAMSWAVNQGIVNGKDGGVLAPSSGMTRAEIATVLMRFLTK